MGDLPTGSYVTPQTDHDHHTLSPERAHSGALAHKAWISSANPVVAGQNTNHRAYPTFQFHKTPEGGFATPVRVGVWVWLDMALRPGQWFSFLTLARRPDDAFWDGVLVNLGAEGLIHLMHVPTVGLAEWGYQDKATLFPFREWALIEAEMSFAPESGYARAYLNGKLVSSASVMGGNGKLEQLHAGLYAEPTVPSGLVYNDDLSIICL